MGPFAGDFCQDRRVLHATKLPALERQMLGYPKIEHDDVLDTVTMACEHLLKG